MKVLFANRFECMQKKGGDTFQMLYTKEYINKYYPEITIKIISSPDEIQKYSDFDLIHVFNIQFYNEVKSYVDEAKKFNLKIAISPIYWNKSDAIYLARMYRCISDFRVISFLRVLKPILNFKIGKMRYLSKDYRKLYKTLLDEAIAIIPNSNEELNIVNQEFHFNSNIKTFVVPNAIVINEVNEDIDTAKRSVLEGCLLEVARIEPIKNQMGVLLACMKTSFPIVFVGADNNPKSKYSVKLHQLAKQRGNVIFTGEIPQKDMWKYYEVAKTHILPSFRESPGLVTLEALFHNCNVVVSNEKYCPIHYYKLDKYGTVCNPYSIKSIETAIKTAMSKPKPKI